MSGWKFRDLEDCIERVTYTPKVQRKDFLNEGTFPIISQEQDFINGYWDDASAVFRVGKPVVIFGDHTQVIKYVDFDFVLGADGVKILRPTDELFSRYFYYFLQSVELKSLGYARHYRLLKEVSVPVPPIEEQGRIVAILDEAFSGLDKAKQNAEKNLQHSRELFESHLQSVFTQRGDGWVEKELREVCSEMTTGPFGSNLHKSDYVVDGIPVVNPQNIIKGEIVPLAKTMVSEKTRQRLSRYILREHDIIIARRGEMGRCGIISREQAGWLCGSGSFMIRVSNNIDARYLNVFLSSAVVKQYLQKGSVGTTMDNLNQSILTSMPVPVPTMPEQQRVIMSLKEIRVETQRLESVYRRKLAALDELKKSLLNKAFSGVLIL